MRLFIAIPLVPALTGYLRSLQDSLRKSEAKITYVREFHLTLRFLGEVQPDQLPALERALGALSMPEFTLALTDVGFFPDQRHPRVVWVGAEPRDVLIRLASDIDRSLTPIGFSKDTRFQPHITLGRVKFSHGLFNLSTERHQQKVDSFDLIESVLTPQGPIYRTVRVYDGTTTKEKDL
jgi:RNA 2',3'-cyclic 3'-phosphodiesterase